MLCDTYFFLTLQFVCLFFRRCNTAMSIKKKILQWNSSTDFNCVCLQSVTTIKWKNIGIEEVYGKSKREEKVEKNNNRPNFIIHELLSLLDTVWPLTESIGNCTRFSSIQLLCTWCVRMFHCWCCCCFFCGCCCFVLNLLLFLLFSIFSATVLYQKHYSLFLHYTNFNGVFLTFWKFILRTITDT